MRHLTRRQLRKLLTEESKRLVLANDIEALESTLSGEKSLSPEAVQQLVDMLYSLAGASEAAQAHAQSLQDSFSKLYDDYYQDGIEPGKSQASKVKPE